MAYLLERGLAPRPGRLAPRRLLGELLAQPLRPLALLCESEAQLLLLRARVRVRVSVRVSARVRVRTRVS